ncbi:MAG: hypothetical protein GF401_07110, partial [Chitinivibrionales bacterium]|nr:hypothetical protein [Chitinivibrionales bacterium]
KEINLWLEKGYTKPVSVVLKHGDFDDEAVAKGKGSKGEEKYKEGNPVQQAQENLKKIDAYSGETDGWFFDKLEAGVKLFQKWAAKGQFIINGVLTDVGEKLTGHKEGELGSETLEFAQRIAAKGGKVPKENAIKKGDKGKIVEEINIRLAGFGGGVPSDTFDDLTESKVKQFQKDYMKMESPTGRVDEETAKAIDEFGEKYSINFDDLKCKCTFCGGFGKARHRNEFKNNIKAEAFHKYEYPGVHRSLLWAIRALSFYLESENDPKMKIHILYDGYRCHDRNAQKGRTSTNHMGKAVDIHIATMNSSNQWYRPSDASTNQKLCDKVRTLCKEKMSAQIRWNESNKLSMEPSKATKPNEALATTWVHIDVRSYNSTYLKDSFFCKSPESLSGEKMFNLLKKG